MGVTLSVNDALQAARHVGDCTEIKGPILLPLGYLTVQDLSLAHHLEMPARQEPLLTDGLSKQGAIHARERAQQIGVHRTRVYLRYAVLQVCRCVYYPTKSFLSIENRPLMVFMPTSCADRHRFTVRRRLCAGGEEGGKLAQARWV
jgi:hypothetical protein